MAKTTQRGSKQMSNKVSELDAEVRGWEEIVRSVEEELVHLHRVHEAVMGRCAEASALAYDRIYAKSLEYVEAVRALAEAERKWAEFLALEQPAESVRAA